MTAEVIPALREELLRVMVPPGSQVMNLYAETAAQVAPEEKHDAIAISMYVTLVATMIGEAIKLADHAPPSVTREQAVSLVKAILESALHDIDLPVEERGEHRRIIDPKGNTNRGDH